MLCVVVYGHFPPKPGTGSDAQPTFALMKTLAGNWQGAITTDRPAWATDQLIPLSIRVASNGNALVHELNTGGPGRANRLRGWGPLRGGCLGARLAARMEAELRREALVADSRGADGANLRGV